MWKRNLLLCAVVLMGVALYCGWVFPPILPARGTDFNADAFEADGFRGTIRNVNASIRDGWTDLQPAPPAEDLVIARRIALALTGRIPSVQDIRLFEARKDPHRLDWWVDTLLSDRRSADYLAERWARAFVGNEDGPFLIFRRRKFVAWLSEQFQQNRPFDEIVRELIASQGLWTDKPATNFLTVTAMQEKKNQPNPERLAGRVARAVLGVRIDCAQCHNHPFEKWKQGDFQGLAAFFGQTYQGFSGIYDADREYTLEDRKTGAIDTIAPVVPFQAELLPADGTRREKLAAWATHPDNRYFPRSTVNRFWALMYGRPLADPVDNIDDKAHDALEILARDFAAHGFDVRRLIRLIASTESFRLDSAADHDITDLHESRWAAFPLTRLRPEQMAGSVLQSSSLSTLDSDSPLLIKFITAVSQNDFVKRYGDTGEDEFTGRGGTIPQRLLLMNGELVYEKTKDGLFTAATRIGQQASTDKSAVEAAYLATLTRRPTDAEAAHFEARLQGTKGDERSRRMEDLFWALINSTEFAWNH